MGASNSHMSIPVALQRLQDEQVPDSSECEEVQEQFWSRFWPRDHLINFVDLFEQLKADDLRTLRVTKPQLFAQLLIRAVDKLLELANEDYCNTIQQHNQVCNCVRLLIRLLPFAYEDEDLGPLLWTGQVINTQSNDQPLPLALRLLNALCDLLFCPDFTVAPNRSYKNRKTNCEPDSPPVSLKQVDSCEHIWKAGVGVGNSSGSGLLNFFDASNQEMFDSHRIDLLRLISVLFSEVMYQEPNETCTQTSEFIRHFTSYKNRHCLALFTSLLNTVLGHQEATASYFALLSTPKSPEVANKSSSKHELVEVSLQLLIVALDVESSQISRSTSLTSNDYVRNPHCSNQVFPTTDDLDSKNGGFNAEASGPSSPDHGSECGSVFQYSTVPVHEENLFITYLARIHREEDLQFVLNGFVRLLANPLIATYFPSRSKPQFHQELLILFWKFCDSNKKFLYHALKSSKILEILVPILYHLNESNGDQNRLGLVHIGVFIILLLSGERNFGVRLNKPFTNNHIVFKNLPIFTGNHADLLIIVFHKLITSGSAKLQALFECLLTIIVNVSPYAKRLCMVSAQKLLHFFEAFSTTWFLYCNETNHHLVFYLLEVFNNIIQYQFDGNASLVYTIIRKRHCFHQLANLPTDGHFISRSLPKSNTKEKIKDKNLQKDSIEQCSNLNEDSQWTEKDICNFLKNDKSKKKNSDFEKTSETYILNKNSSSKLKDNFEPKLNHSPTDPWRPTSEWVLSWKQKLPLQTIMRMLQVLVPQVEKMCLDKGISDESEILKFLENGTLVGLLPVPHPILIRKYQTNLGTSLWFRTYIWGVIYLRNISPAIWYETEVKLFEIQKH